MDGCGSRLQRLAGSSVGWPAGRIVNAACRKLCCFVCYWLHPMYIAHYSSIGQHLSCGALHAGLINCPALPAFLQLLLPVYSYRWRRWHM